MKTALLTGLLILALSTAALAQDVQEKVDDVIARMGELSGDEYLKARADGVTLAVQAKDYLETKSAADVWDSDKWSDALFATLLLGWSGDAGVFEACYRLEGIKPESYRKKRLPMPFLSRELENLGKPAVPAMIEICLKTAEGYPLGTRPAEPGADAETAAETERVRQVERRALLHGIVEALGKIGDRRAFRFLCEVLESSGEEELCIAAADSAALCGGTDSVAMLVRLLSDENTAERVRAACARALGYPHTEAGLGALKNMLSSDSIEVRSGAIEGLARMASLRRWKTSGSLENTDVRKTRGEAAVALADRLAAEKSRVVRRRIVGALGRVADTSVLEQLKTLVQEAPDEDIKAAAADAVERISKRAPAPVSGE